MKQLTEKQKRERKFLLMLPVLVLPFLCMAFWAMGGGKQGGEFGNEPVHGFNMTLPEARIESVSMDKMASYEQAERKATQLRDRLRMDPFANSSGNDTTLLNPLGIVEGSTLRETEDAVQAKLSELQELIDRPLINEDYKAVVGGYEERGKDQDVESVDQDLKKLESMMHTVLETDREDPEMQRIDKLLDKLLDVQHPQRVQERLSEAKQLEKQAAFAVSLDPHAGKEREVTERGFEQRERNGFYTLQKEVQKSFSAIQPAISAEVTRDQKVVTGASIELALTQSVFIEGVEFPKGSRITGVCSLRGERLNINVDAIRSGNLILPVSLEAIDLDALPGIKIPDAITRGALKDGAGEGVESLGMMGMSSSWEAQASMAGMETVKGVLSKKAKLVKVTVKAGHPLFLADLSSK